MCAVDSTQADGHLGLGRLLCAAIAVALLIAEVAFYMLGDRVAGWLPDGLIATALVVAVSVAAIAVLAITIRPPRVNGRADRP
jgi:hypothetical protein